MGTGARTDGCVPRIAIRELEVWYNESKDCNGMCRMQTEELQYQEEQEKRSGQDRDEEILQVLP